MHDFHDDDEFYDDGEIFDDLGYLGAEKIRNTLKFTLNVDDTVNWDKLKDTSTFLMKRPSQPELMPLSKKPDKSDHKYNPNINIIDEIFPSLKRKKIRSSRHRFNRDYELWSAGNEHAEQKNKKIIEPYNWTLQEWEEQYSDFQKRQEEFNSKIDKKKEEYLNRNPDVVLEYCHWVLTYSKYPDFFPKEFDVDYNPENCIAIVDYLLPSIEDFPTLYEHRFDRRSNKEKHVFLYGKDLENLYDDLLYQISLRTIHELFEADTADALKAVVFNGWVNSVDKSIGQKVKCCILSVQANKEEFVKINLELIDPKACFKNLKGVSAAKLHGITPIAPLLKIDKDDKRFISSYEVVNGMDKSTNLAAMNWEDFEHLVREIFEKEFSENGGEVKVTQASRDGGVDAIAFDPDPIRGGKIVIQAKRYTNVVGVSAVRDLYGTVMNEGAMKGILITTSNYGSDAYEFAKGKPLTLLNGSNLLHLLEKHGHKAKIDLKEAKEILSEKTRKQTEG